MLFNYNGLASVLKNWANRKYGRMVEAWRIEGEFSTGLSTTMVDRNLHQEFRVVSREINRAKLSYFTTLTEQMWQAE